VCAELLVLFQQLLSLTMQLGHLSLHHCALLFQVFVLRLDRVDEGHNVLNWQLDAFFIGFWLQSH
jgi:hypothetical protein